MSYKRKISYEDQKKLDRFAFNLQTLRKSKKKTVKEIADYLRTCCHGFSLSGFAKAP